MTEEAEISTATKGYGNGGLIELYADSIRLIEANILSNTFGSGNGGRIIVKINESLMVSGLCGIIAGSTGKESGKAGDIEIEAKQITLKEGGQIASHTIGTGDAGSVIIKIADTLTISGLYEYELGKFSSSAVVAASYSTESNARDAGDLEIEADQIVITDGAQINSVSIGGGEGGTILIKIADTLSLSGSDEKGFSAIAANSLYEGEYGGKAGKIEIEAHQIEIKNGAQINSTTFGGGNAGSINIVTDTLTASGWPEDETQGDSGIYCNSHKEEGNGGDAGVIQIKADQIILHDGAKIASNTRNSGKSGSIRIVADTLTASGYGSHGNGPGILANSLSTEDDGGDTGYIEIQAREITLMDGAQISNGTWGGGNADSIVIKVTESLTASGESNRGNSGIHINSEKESTGNAGYVEIKARDIILKNGGAIASQTKGSGKGGSIIIIADTLEASGYRRDGTGSLIGADSLSEEDDGGDTGYIEIQARKITLLDGAQISSGTGGGGNGDAIIIKVTESLTASGESKTGNYHSGIYTKSVGKKKYAGKAGRIEIEGREITLKDGVISTSSNNTSGGEITITIPNLLYLRNGVITTSVQGGDGTGGDITIEHPVFVIMDKGVIEANAHEGTGGNIAITAEQLIRSSDSTVTASSDLGIDGTVNIEAPDTDISASLTVLPEKFSDASALLYDHCATRKKETTSRLVNTGLGNALMAPDDFFTDTVHEKSEKDKISPADQDSE